MTNKTIIKTCTCFLDIALLHIKDKRTSFDYADKCKKIHFEKDIFYLHNRMKIHYKEKNESSVDTVVSVCVKCAKFQIALKANLGELDNIRCRFVKNNVFACEPENDFDEVSGNRHEETVDFFRKPLVKSCFTESVFFDSFCRFCGHIYKSIFEPSLIVFSRADLIK